MFISLLFGILDGIKASAFSESYRPGRSVYRWPNKVWRG